jgi:hypothetical protein
LNLRIKSNTDGAMCKPERAWRDTSVSMEYFSEALLSQKAGARAHLDQR